MIYIRIEMWPRGTREKARLLGEATIGNIGGNAQTGDYNIRLSRTSPSGNPAKVGFVEDPARSAVYPPGKDCWRATQLKGYPRASLVMWHLIARALTKACQSQPLRKRRKRPSKASP